jgi:hypothetical protein
MKAKWPKITGLVLHILIAVPVLLAGSIMVLELIPQTELEKLGPMGQQIRLIGIGEIITAVLLVIPRTSSLGVLLASGFWGGTICFHMSRGELYVVQSALLLLTWVGAYLRNPATFGSFSGSSAPARKVVEESAPVLQ